jgi:Acyl-CoA reductase (LuxC)
MTAHPIAEIGEALAVGDGPVVRLPALVKGKLVFPPRIPLDRLRTAVEHNVPARNGGARPEAFVEGAWVVRQPIVDRGSLEPTGDHQFLVLPAVDPDALVERDLGRLANGLYSVPFAEVLDYVGALRQVLRANPGLVDGVVGYTRATSLIHDRAIEVLVGLLPELLDPKALAEAVERELGDASGTGAAYLDGWVPIPATVHRGMTARVAQRLFATSTRRARPHVRALPTRQLHITSGNAPVVPFVSAVRAFATKSAAVIKSAAEATSAATLLAAAMQEVDPDHPLTRHTSLVYWPGGDRRVEDVLFAQGAFDRLLVWGSAETVLSVAARARFTKTLFFNPRIGMSLIGREAFPRRLREVAARATADALIADQNACTSSLVQYVEASESDALEYCGVLRETLRQWDRAIPHGLSRRSVGRLRALRTGEFVQGSWFENGRWPETTSVVVYMPSEFDLSAHPLCRLVVVRAVPDLAEAMRFVHAGVSTVGVYPERTRMELRTELASRGVSNVFPLGECERIYAGMPQDGMRVLSELVSWANA